MSDHGRVPVISAQESGFPGLTKAIRFAAEVHDGQVDKTGTPYIFHVLRVAESVRRTGGWPVDVIAAILHDVIEDTDTTYSDLRVEFTDTVAGIVNTLTHWHSESYDDYIARIATSGKSAIRIKVADLRDNLDASRGAVPNPKREERYRKALKTLEPLT